MANLKISLRKKGASSFEGGDKLLPETDWAYILNKPPTFVPDPHGHAIEDITGLQNALNGQITQSWVTANTRSKTWVPLWSEVTGLVDQLDNKASAMHAHTWDSIQSKPTFASVATSGSYNDLSNKPSIPSIPSVMTTTEGNTGTATTQRTINAANLKSIILNHSPAGSRPASDVKTWAKADNKPSYTWSEIGSKPSVIIEGDARLTNARPASDVHGWAKAENRPTYDLSQIEETTTYKRVTENEKIAWNFKADITDIEGLLESYDAHMIIPQLNNKLSSSLKGSANGLAELDSNGKVPSSQLPSFVDDVLEYTKLSAFPATGESGKIYIATDTNKTYRWSGSGYTEISASLALGETQSTAYRGDRGKAAYDHSLLPHAPSNAQANVIESIKVNGTSQTVTSKAVNITVPTKASDVSALASNHPASGVTTTKINYWDSAYADTNNASNANTANRIVKRDAYGNFAAGTVIANLTGTASGNLTPDSTLNPAKVAQNSSYRFVTDSEKNAWNLKQTAGQVEAIIGNFETDIIIPQLNNKLSSSLKGSANGLAELGSDGKVPSSQLPSYVDDVLEYTKLSSFPTTGESGKIYIDLATNKTYRWGGSGYVVISETLALGTTSSTAYRGDRGKAAYDHSLLPHAPSNAQKNSDITKAEIEAKLKGAITSHTHAYLADNHPASGVTTTKINYWDSAYVDTSNATHVGTPNRIVRRNANGDFAAGTITANLAGIASGNLTPDSTLNPAKVAQNSSYRFVTDSEKNAWNAKQTQAQVESLLESYDAHMVSPQLAQKLSASAKGETGNKVLSYGGTFKVLQTLANGTVNERTMTMPSGLKPTFTELGYRTSEGNSTIAALSNYELFYVSIFFIASSLNDLENTVGGFIWNNSIPFSISFFDHNQIANVFLNASVNGTSFRVDSNGEMPFGMISGSKGFSVTIYGVKFE